MGTSAFPIAHAMTASLRWCSVILIQGCAKGLQTCVGAPRTSAPVHSAEPVRGDLVETGSVEEYILGEGHRGLQLFACVGVFVCMFTRLRHSCTKGEDGPPCEKNTQAGYYKH